MYYVAKMYDTLNPSIVEKFDNLADAQLYADLMTRTKNYRYTVLVENTVTMEVSEKDVKVLED